MSLIISVIVLITMLKSIMAFVAVVYAPDVDPSQRTLDQFLQGQAATATVPQPFVDKEEAGLYNMSPPWLIDVFLATTERERGQVAIM